MIIVTNFVERVHSLAAPALCALSAARSRAFETPVRLTVLCRFVMGVSVQGLIWR